MGCLTFFVFLPLLALALGNPFPKFDNTKISNNRIVGGLIAEKGQFPYQVSLQHLIYGHFCGGSILNEKWILTAAHCTHNQDQSAFSIVVGVTSMNEIKTEGSTYDISKIIVHPDYNNNKQYSNDLSLIKVKDSIKFSATVKSIELPTFDMNKDGLPVIETGWGSQFSGGIVSQKLQYLLSEVYDHESCIKRMAEIPNFPSVTEKHICTFTKKGEGLCHGDSGGPIVSDGIQVGIVSLGNPCARGYPDLNTHVWSFLDWIKSHISEH